MNYEELAADVVKRACSAGAEEADVYLQTSTDFNVDVRQGEIEKLTQAGGKGLGLRVFVDRRLGFASTSDFTPSALQELVERTVALARVADRKEENGLPEESRPVQTVDLGLYDPEIDQVEPDEKIRRARECEAAAFAVDKRITNSEGAGFGSGSSINVLANSRGFQGAYQVSSCSVYCQPVAEQEGKKQVDYDYSFKRVYRELEPSNVIGERAAHRVLRKLGSCKIPTQSAPIIFERRVAARIWYGVLAAVNGDSVFKGMSFLKEKLGERIAAEHITLIDDPLLPGGAGSSPFDGEGLPTHRNVILQNGVLQMFQYDTVTARKVGGSAHSTANARRSSGSAPSIGPFNLYLEPGKLSLEEIIKTVDRGLLVTDMMGSGCNPVTGDFSVGVAGLWIENGELTHAVEEVTIAGSMLEILASIEQIGSDLIFSSSVCSPSFKVAQMTISGE